MDIKIQKNTIGLKDLRENMETSIKRVNEGESITVFRRSTPLFRISPIDAVESGRETVIDFTKEAGDGISDKELLRVMKRVHE
ncbi:type II toxin-antitoxin system prevent-host-death family antitoxin [Candidatus Nomurabacteria bacterium]|nr:type II toxin-antitoxin system prevent-host-death family antitoxin [Candidatus Kaiserbacteria bacterium]MCB9814769.1 type II toxin-antitoxin system prevent-host-death family antitoxin [Candidatus Nomurabacteria bacterium]